MWLAEILSMYVWCSAPDLTLSLGATTYLWLLYFVGFEWRSCDGLKSNAWAYMNMNWAEVLSKEPFIL